MHNSLDPCCSQALSLPITQEGFCPNEPRTRSRQEPHTAADLSVPNPSLVMFSWYLSMTQSRPYSFQDMGVDRQRVQGGLRVRFSSWEAVSSWEVVQRCAEWHFHHFQGALLFPVPLKQGAGPCSLIKRSDSKQWAPLLCRGTTCAFL